MTAPPGFGIVAAPAATGSTTLVVVDASNFPPTGYVKVGSDPATTYSRSGNVMHLGDPLQHDVQAGDRIEVGTGLIIGAEGQGSGCAVRPGTAGCLDGVVVGLAVLIWARRRCPGR